MGVCMPNRVGYKNVHEVGLDINRRKKAIKSRRE